MRSLSLGVTSWSAVEPGILFRYQSSAFFSAFVHICDAKTGGSFGPVRILRFMLFAFSQASVFTFFSCCLVQDVSSSVVSGGGERVSMGLTVSYWDIVFQFSLSRAVAPSEMDRLSNFRTTLSRCRLLLHWSGNILASAQALAIILDSTLVPRM